MQPVVRKFKSFAEAEKAEIEYYHSLTPDERIAIAREIIRQVHPDIDSLPDVRAYHKLHGKSAIIFTRR